MSNNRSSNRRRGRGGSRPQGGGQLNRIDSRARGNAPQLLEKYKKLAHDAALNGDRVQAEYYLQFADHYFRVIADTKAQKEEARAKREAEREQQDDEAESEEAPDRGSRRGRGRRSERNPSDGEEGERGTEDGESEEFEAAENPFTRESRQRPRRTRKDAESARSDGGDSDGDAGDDAGFDPSVLPPSIGKGEDEEAEKPRKPRRTKSRGGDDDAPLEAVG